MAHTEKELSNDPVKRGHETSDADPKSVTISGIAISVGLMTVAIVACWGLYVYLKSIAPEPDAPPRTFVVPDSAHLPAQPLLQADPHTILVPFVKSQDSLLASYGWVSKDSGIARIPVERAMELVVSQGLPVQGK